MDTLGGRHNEPRLEDEGAEQTTEQTKHNMCEGMEGLEFTGPAVDLQPGAQYPKENEKMGNSQVHTSRSQDEWPSQTALRNFNNSEYSSFSIGPQKRQKQEIDGAEGFPVAWYCFRAFIYIILRHGPQQMCNYKLEKTKFRDSDQVKQLQPVCNNIGSILDIRSKNNLLRRRYNCDNIQCIVGVAIPVNPNIKVDEHNLSELDITKGAYVLVEWQNIGEEHLHLFCGKQSWMSRSALSRMATSRKRTEINEKIKRAYVIQMTKYEQWRERECQERSIPLNPFHDNWSKRGTHNPGQNYFIHEKSKTNGPATSHGTAADIAGNDGGNDTPGKKGIEAGVDTIQGSQIKIEKAERSIIRLASARTFSYKSHLELEKAFKGVHGGLRARNPEEYASRMDMIVATWPSYKDEMISRGFREVGAFPDEKSIANAKTRLIAAGKWL